MRSSLVAALLVSLVWLGCSDGTNQLTAPDGLVPDISVVSQDAFGLAIAAQENHTPRLLTTPGLIGTAVGLAENGQPVVKLFVTTAGVGGLPVSLDGIPVVVEITGEIFALPHRCGHDTPRGDGDCSDEDPPPEPEDETIDRTARFERPVPIGVSTGHPDITAGTIGARVTKVVDGETFYYALSNNHVYANQNHAGIGDNVLQPGTYDGGKAPDDVIGKLAAFKEIDFGGLNVIDAAIALSSTSNLGKATPSDGYGAPKSSTVNEQDLRINQKVKKYGRTTGLTKGQVYALNASVNINYGDGNVALFVGQIIITPGGFSAGGDSGSVIVIDDRKGKRSGPDDLKPVGLLFAGSSMITVANPIDAVLAEFGVTIDGD